MFYIFCSQKQLGIPIHDRLKKVRFQEEHSVEYMLHLFAMTVDVLNVEKGAPGLGWGHGGGVGVLKRGVAHQNFYPQQMTET